MDAQIPQVGPGDHLAHGVGQGPDAQLQGGAIHHVLHHVLGDLHLRLAGSGGLDAGQRAVRTLHDHVHIVDVDALIQTAIDPGQILVDLQDHHVGLIQHRPGRGVGHGEVEVSMLVHGSHTGDGHVYREEMVIVGSQIPEHHGIEIAQSPVTELPLVAGHVPAVIDKVLPVGIALHHLNGLLDQITPDLHTPQLVLPLGNGLIHQGRESAAHGNIQPVAALDHPGRLLRGAQLAFIFRRIVKRYRHSLSASFSVLVLLIKSPFPEFVNRLTGIL